MARNHLTRKLEIYQALACINEHFQAISHHVHDVAQTGFFPGKKMNVFQGLIRELQSQISHDICDRMHDMEDEHMFEFGKVRIAWENYLNPDRAPFTTSKPAANPTPNGRALETVTN